MMQTPRKDVAPVMPVGFAGGSPELWDGFHQSSGELMPDKLYFRSAPARAIYATLVSRVAPAANEMVVELGCGGSRWLRILSQRFGLQPWGVDFSARGVESTRRQLLEAGVDSSHVTLGEIHDFADRHPGRFDLVLSFGLIEHFDDLTGIVRAHVRCARPGGRIFVTAPNLTSLNLRWARAVAPDIFSWHRPISAAEVVQALERLHCVDIRSDHLGGPRLFVGPTATGCPAPGTRKAAHVALKALNGTGEILHRISPGLASSLAGPWLSPHFAVSATTPAT